MAGARSPKVGPSSVPDEQARIAAFERVIEMRREEFFQSQIGAGPKNRENRQIFESCIAELRLQFHAALESSCTSGAEQCVDNSLALAKIPAREGGKVAIAIDRLHIAILRRRGAIRRREDAQAIEPATAEVVKCVRKLWKPAQWLSGYDIADARAELGLRLLDVMGDVMEYELDGAWAQYGMGKEREYVISKQAGLKPGV